MKRTRFRMRPEQRLLLQAQSDLERAKAEDEARPRIGPKNPPIFLPEKPNPDGY